MPKTWEWGFKPSPLTGMRNFPPADTEYGQGFKDGCTASFAAVGKGYIDSIKPKMNTTLMMKSPDYASGWYDGTEQCVYIIDWDTL